MSFVLLYHRRIQEASQRKCQFPKGTASVPEDMTCFQELLSSCEKLGKDDKDKLLICNEKITDININKLRDMPTKDICIEQKFCNAQDEITSVVFENTPPENMTIQPIPEIVNATQKRSKALAAAEPTSSALTFWLSEAVLIATILFQIIC
uniref:CX9C domain-containing protein n=1 Tax=Steinernema glaseri TaxID=37863 RepID=A0A1I7ZQT9_9BILA